MMADPIERIDSPREGTLHEKFSTKLLKKEKEEKGTILSNYPVAFLGLALGCSGCGKAWLKLLTLLNYQDWVVATVEGTFENLSLLILIVYLTRVMVHPKIVRKELLNVEAHACLCAGSMSLASNASFWQRFFPNICAVVWFISFLAHLGLSFDHFRIRWIHFKMIRALGKTYIEVLYPPILLPTVGIAMIPLTAESFGAWETKVGDFIFWYAAAFCWLLQPILTYRMFCGDRETINKKLLPTFFIYIAPCALLMCAYHNLGYASKAFSLFFFSTQIICTILFCFFTPRFIGLSFSPAWCAATFPCMISTSSFINVFVTPSDSDNYAILIFVFTFLSIATLVVVVIFILAVKWLWKSLEDNSHLPLSPSSPRSKLQMLCQNHPHITKSTEQKSSEDAEQKSSEDQS